MNMSIWISDSVSLLRSVASLLTSTPILYITGCLILLFSAKLFKSLTGG